MKETLANLFPAAWFVGVASISLALLAGFFGAYHPALDSMAHFRAHLAVLLAAGALPLLLTSRFRLQGLAALAFGISGLATVSGWLGLPSLGSDIVFAARNGDRAVYRLLQLNLLHDNPEPGRVLSLIGRTQPDVITLNEVSAQWRERLPVLFAAYPHNLVCQAGHRIGAVAILSRRPFAADEGPGCLEKGALAIRNVDFSGQLVTVAAVHLGWPWPFGQDRQIERMAQPLRGLGADAILAGDFNAAPWSEAVRRMAAAGGLWPVPGIGPTWVHRRLPDSLKSVGLPIDQVMVKGRVLVHAATTAEAVGSDHLPILVEFSIAPGARPADEDAPSETVMKTGSAGPAPRDAS